MIIWALGVMNNTIIAVRRPRSDNVVNAVISLMPYLVPNIFVNTIIAKNAMAIPTSSGTVIGTFIPRIGSTDSNCIAAANAIRA